MTEMTEHLFAGRWAVVEAANLLERGAELAQFEWPQAGEAIEDFVTRLDELRTELELDLLSSAAEHFLVEDDTDN